METEGVKERLTKYLEYKGISQSRFEKSLGMSNGYVNNIRMSITPDKLQKIALSYPDLNIAWLMIGKTGGEMTIGNTQGSPLSKKETDEKPEANALPLIPFDAVAGPGTPIYEDERVGEYYYVSEFKECDFLIRVKGDSMAPHFAGGDLLACRKVVDAFFFQWGRCYVVYTRSQGVMVKRIQPSEKEGYIQCVSDNPKYAPFDVPLEDVVSVALVNGSISLE